MLVSPSHSQGGCGPHVGTGRPPLSAACILFCFLVCRQETGAVSRVKGEGVGHPMTSLLPLLPLWGVQESCLQMSLLVFGVCSPHLHTAPRLQQTFLLGKVRGTCATPPNRRPASVLQVESWGPCPHSGTQLHLAAPLQGYMSPGGSRGMAATCGPGGTLIIREPQPSTAQRWPAPPTPGHPGLFSPGQNKRLLSGRVQRDDCPPRLQLWRGSAVRDKSRSFGRWGAALPHPSHR